VTRIYPQEFRDQIVSLHLRDGRTFADIAKEFSLSATTIAKWVREVEDSDKAKRGARGEQTVAAGDSDRERIARLERELARKNEEVEILGKALAFFVRRSER
jgi:transposase